MSSNQNILLRIHISRVRAPSVQSGRCNMNCFDAAHVRTRGIVAFARHTRAQSTHSVHTYIVYMHSTRFACDTQPAFVQPVLASTTQTHMRTHTRARAYLYRAQRWKANNTQNIFLMLGTHSVSSIQQPEVAEKSSAAIVRSYLVSIIPQHRQQRATQQYAAQDPKHIFLLVLRFRRM